MTRLETQVSKTDPTIKKIIAATSGSDATEWPGGSPTRWSGRLVSVVQVDPGFTYNLYNDTGEPRVYQVRNIQARMLTVSRVPRPSYGAPATEIFAPAYGEVVVTRQIGPTGRITIYAPELDAATLDVARDALLLSDKKLFAEVLKGFGDYAGIARAILEAQSKTLEKVSSGKTSRQLDREIAEFLRSRN
jgi:hypothetical protein